ncbi:hypothetical protein [Desulfoscipio gibsoniae]|uniref:Lipoprotein n=1 Tax=Desulfoscipio gibsoniae DSM 7213 TaxID=767817 RepID=R4KCM5_9FIRM|nr:hypothetical protein [Desulfoscipio gibsoniae]AGL00329.1 hypothetical protein Desgi_0777 [Desulfoscipio gibsoniae DSM 7213]
MKKLTVFVLALSTLVIFGCNQAQQKPAPPEQTLIPKESSIGFSQVDIDELPASIKKVSSTTEDRPMVTWAHDNNNSYILLNTGQDEEDLKVSKVIQRVPVQDFLWLDVQLDYTDGEKAKDKDGNLKLVAVKLDKTDKAINGVGFEIKEESEEDEEDPEEGKAQAAPTPAPTPAPTTREPVTQARPTQEIKQPAPARETRPEEQQPQNQSQQDSETKADEQQQPTPATPNGD